MKYKKYLMVYDYKLDKESSKAKKIGNGKLDDTRILFDTRI